MKALSLGSEDSARCSYLFGESGQLLRGSEIEHVSGLGEKDALVSCFHAAGNLVSNRSQENVHEEVVGGRRDVALGKEDLVVASFHEILLE